MPAFRHILEQEIQFSEQLLKALQEEYNALTRADPAAIDAKARDKQRLFDAIERLEHARLTLLTEAGCEGDVAGVEGYIARHATQQRGELNRLWSHLTEIVSACRDQNTVNGNIIEVCGQRARQALTLLRGQMTDNSLYDPSGKPVGGRSTHSLIKA